MAAPLTHEQNLWRWRVLISTYFGYAGYYLTRRVFSICKKDLIGEFHWEITDVAHLWTAFLVAYMVGQFLNSYLGRRFGPRVILLVGLAISIGCGIVFGFANSYWTFLVFMIINGLVQATGWPGAVGSIAKWLRAKERGSFIGVWSTSYQIGTTVVYLLGGFLLSYHWRYAFFGCTAAAMGIWWLLYFWQRNKPEDVGLSPIVEEEEGRTVKAGAEENISFAQYLQVAFHPVVLMMGASYFCVKFLRYALDSWLPTFFSYQGLSAENASYVSAVFPIAGLVGVVLTGIALDRLFRGRWATLCFVMALGMIGAYYALNQFGNSWIASAVCVGVVGMLIYGPDTILCGAAAVEVAGGMNAVVVAGIVNGIGSIGPIFQEEIIGRLMKGDPQQGMRATNLLYLSMSIVFAAIMLFAMWRLRLAREREAAVASGDFGPLKP